LPFETISNMYKLSYRIERTSEFLVYGHSHQRRAVIEAVRLLENENSVLKNHDECKVGEDSNEVLPPEYFKDKSKKWQKFVTQVTEFLTGLLLEHAVTIGP